MAIPLRLLIHHISTTGPTWPIKWFDAWYGVEVHIVQTANCSMALKLSGSLAEVRSIRAEVMDAEASSPRNLEPWGSAVAAIAPGKDGLQTKWRLLKRLVT